MHSRRAPCFTLFSVQCRVNIAQCTVYSVQCTVYSVNCRVNIVKCTMMPWCLGNYVTAPLLHQQAATEHQTMYSLHSTLNTHHCVQCVRRSNMDSSKHTKTFFRQNFIIFFFKLMKTTFFYHLKMVLQKIVDLLKLCVF